MGRKKGRQAGEWCTKAQHAVHRHTVYVDHASEANQYRNPMLTADLGRGHGYRNASSSSDKMGGSNGYWHINGSAYGGGDKWSSIFSSSRSCHTHTRAVNGATLGLSRLRHLLEERRSEDRVYERQHRLRLQRSRMIEVNGGALSGSGSRKSPTSTENNRKVGRHEPGWLLSHGYSTSNLTEKVTFGENNTQQSTETNSDTTSRAEIPSLQKLTSQTLGPLLPMYCAACGSEFVGESLKSVSASIISELSISLATADWLSASAGNQDESAIFATTDGALKALVKSGVATGLVLRGAPLLPLNKNAICTEDEDVDGDTRLLSDDGLLSLCPRILSTSNDEDTNTHYSEDDASSQEHWETLDFDMGLSQLGCFHLIRLELIDIPMRRHGASSGTGGISLSALRSVLRACSGITHLSLSGCFYNWEDAECLPVGELDNISLFLGGNQSQSSLPYTLKMLHKLRGNSQINQDLIPMLLYHQENVGQTDEVSGLDRMLPELRVLDISYCSWVTEYQVIHLLLKLWEKAFDSTIKVSSGSFNESQWEDEGERLCSGASTMNDDAINSGNNQLHHLNIRGAIEGTQWIEKWRRCGLFDGIDVSTERQVRR